MIYDSAPYNTVHMVAPYHTVPIIRVILYYHIGLLQPYHNAGNFNVCTLLSHVFLYPSAYICAYAHNNITTSFLQEFWVLYPFKLSKLKRQPDPHVLKPVPEICVSTFSEQPCREHDCPVLTVRYGDT